MTSIARLLPSRRIGNLAGFLACAGLLGFGYYLQYAQGIQPCPLCIMQRVAFLAAGMGFLAAAIHNPAPLGARIYGAWITLSALSGMSIAIRHVWLQHTPAELRPACGPGLEYLFGTFGPFDALRKVLRGSGECGAVDWTLLGFSIPELALVAFVGLAAWAAFFGFRK
jgi:protein dithiol:quinone oxidoreductase